MIHHYPITEEEKHELKGTMCPCGPTVDWYHPEGARVMHRRFTPLANTQELANDIAEKHE